MSGTVRTGVVFGLATAAAIIGAQLLGLFLRIPGIGFLSVVALGLAAGYTAAKVTNAPRDRRIGRGATAGAIAGLIVLLGAVLGGVLITFLPAYQAQIAAVTQQLQQDPNFSNSGVDPAQLTSFIGSAAGPLGGFCAGLFYLLIMVLCGLIGSLFWRGASASDYAGAGGSAYGAAPSGSYIPNQTNQSYGSQTSTGTSDVEPGVRVYDDPNDPNRRQ